ncbi:PadR family transcriptional regulator [Clostridium sp. MSJ-11]|uniref:PadR family transcriptional regulator n=1 Tax=Clostridium mobile TaxID=2841512 RepID=A0ABS6ELL9_9CLOT|nr:PadR family transcriptional regulator [Clostridium mobile]MBU5485915.1 PadR family transcriptional regulator [Clostridium mobile]
MDIQLKKGVLELCVLESLYRKDCYGYELVDQVSKIIDISEGTIYPLLKRLQNDKYLEYYIKESSVGPPRKYYKITLSGIEHYKNQREEWFRIFNSVTDFLKGVDINE